MNAAALKSEYSLDELRQLLDTFSDVFEVATALLDLDGNVLVASRWQDACTKFHRVNPTTSARCLESDTALAGALTAGHDYNVYRCKNGLVDVAVPVRLAGEHMGNLFAGQFFFKRPDLNYFINQAAQVGFEQSSYISAIESVPVYPEERIHAMLRFLVKTAELIGEATLKRVQLHDALLRVADSEAKLLSILDGVDAYIYLKDPTGKYTFANKAARELWKVAPEEIIGFGDEKFFDSATVAQIRANDAEVLVRGLTVRREEENTVLETGEHRYYLSTKLPLRDHEGKLYALCGISVDITEQKKYQFQLHHMAHFDALTQLPNRVLLADRLKVAISQCHRNQTKIAVVFIDLDNFKDANDAHGHHIGDLLLSAVADRLQKGLRSGDTLSRLGGDEFVAVFTGIKDDQEIEQVVNRLRELSSSPFLVQGIEVSLTASIGVTHYPQSDQSVDADQLVRQADHAMYFAKQSGGNRFIRFDSMKDRSAKEKFGMVKQVSDAIDARQLILYYQPKVNMRTRELVGVEALIRWQHPQKGIVSPQHFMPAIENDDLIIELGDYVIEMALEQLVSWVDQGHPISVSVNTASRQILHPQFIDKLKAALFLRPNAVGLLDLEIVESSSLDDLTAVPAIIAAAKSLGATFSLDDFGTGYSSLTYLKNLPVNTLKIDQSFVRGSLNSPEDLGILKVTIELARLFGMQLVAEGVETEQHVDKLIEIGCDIGQGYTFAKPMPGDQVLRWYSEWAAHQKS